MSELELSKYKNDFYKPGSKLKILIWILVSYVFFENSLPIPSFLKCIILRFFGAVIGANVVIKPGCKIKYPWFLSISDNVWLGENCWIDNLAHVDIERNCCISQGAYLFTGNHNYKKSTFDLVLYPITLKRGSWVGAKSIVCPGVVLGKYSILTVGSVAVNELAPYGVYQGNPAMFKRNRVFD